MVTESGGDNGATGGVGDGVIRRVCVCCCCKLPEAPEDDPQRR